MKFDEIILIRGGGDLATGVVQKFWRAGFPVAVLETAEPTAIRRTVALSEAICGGVAKVEDVVARRIDSPGRLAGCWQAGEVPMLVDPDGVYIHKINPACMVDAILAKRNLGTRIDMAGVTIGLGPGFCAGKDVRGVIETMRGHDLGRLILDGCAMPNTGLPGEISGKSADRVLRAPHAGKLIAHKEIGCLVKAGEVIFTVDETPVTAPFTGLLRGMLRDGGQIPKGMKTADLDPRCEISVNTISDKARCLGGAALEAYLYLR
ncbi:MAG: selenium-dependent molybdenum cofactor biosynthesis protein YqeB [Oscillospiraceae bacterium]|nr:selenium-dependent molybdenum cofactor biosynthesis protein YqeB [Oscillospiraceae bacterium]